jgi:hypothetical protein
MVTPGVDWDCCMGLPLTGDAEVDFPCCAGPPTVTGAAVESVADFLVAAEAYDLFEAGGRGEDFPLSEGEEA